MVDTLFDLDPKRKPAKTKTAPVALERQGFTPLTFLSRPHMTRQMPDTGVIPKGLRVGFATRVKSLHRRCVDSEGVTKPTRFGQNVTHTDNNNG
jgi:hypothetical protein